MGWTDLILRLRALVRHGRVEGELDEELRFHMEMEARKSRAMGMTGEDARRSARVHFGGVEQVREECRDVRGLTVLENLARDIRYGVRVLLKTPAFTAIAVLSLGIGIGANTAVFSLVDTVMLRMLPVRNPEQLVVAKWGASKGLDLNAYWATGGGDGRGSWTENVFSWAAFSEMRGRSRAVSDVMGFSPLGSVSVGANGQALPTGAMVISGNYFQALGVRTVFGRPILDDDDNANGLPSAVITYRFWDRVFARDMSAIGKTLYINGQPCIVVGIAPKEFFGVSAGGFMGTPQVDIMLPLRFRDRMQVAGQKRVAWFLDDMLWIQAMGRLKPGSETAARSELAAIVKANLPESARSALGSESPRVYLDPGGQGLDGLRRAFRQPLLILMAVVGLTLLMACANLAGLLLARAAARQKEIMLRLAVGASRGRLVRQLLVEGAVLSAAGTAAALAFAWWGVRALLAMAASRSAPIPVEVSPDARVFAFTAAVSLATTFLFALAPALRATRVDVASGLKQDVAAAPAIRSFGMGSVLVAVQVAVALVLLAGATLFTRSLANLRSLPLGFNPRNVVVFNLDPGENGYDGVRGNQLYTRVRERLNQTRGVTRASLSANRLISGWVSNGPILPDGNLDRNGVESDYNLVGPDFFEVMGIPVILGRGIEPRDMTSTPRIAVMNEALARQCFGGESPVGRRFRWSWKKEWDVEVIGVVKDAKFDRLRGDAPPRSTCPIRRRHSASSHR